MPAYGLTEMVGRLQKLWLQNYWLRLERSD
jgi:hypothetical protein